MLDTVLGIATSGGFGAIIGAAGSWLSKWEERKLRKLEFEHELKMRAQSLEELRIEQSHAIDMIGHEIEKVETEGQVATDIKEADAFVASVMANAKSTGIVFVDAIRGLMRPLITTYLLGLATYLAYNVAALVGGLEVLPMTELVELYKHIVMQLVFLTNVVISWWFGSRPQGQLRR